MDKKEAINKAITDITKKYGKGAIMNFEEIVVGVEFVPSGSMGLNWALGGGYPKGRIIEIYGPESSGKTTLTLHAIAEAQAAGGTAAFIDAEHSFDPVYAKKLGVQMGKDDFLFVQPDSGEQALEIVDILTNTNAVDIIVIDSVAALIPQAELDGEMGDSKMGLHARLMSQAMRKLCGVVKKTSTILIFTNQLRDKIGVMFGSPETTTGGNALKFYASQRLDIRRITTNKDKNEVAVSNRVRVKVKKNKVAPPFREAEFDIIYGTGIDKFNEIIEIAIKEGIIKRSGSWYSYGDTKLGQGINVVQAVLVDNPELLEEITALVAENFKK